MRHVLVKIVIKNWFFKAWSCQWMLRLFWPFVTQSFAAGAELQIQNEGEEGEDEDGASIRAKVVTEAKYGTPSPNSPRPDPSNSQASSAHLPMGQGNVALDDIIDHNYAISTEWLVQAVFNFWILNTIFNLLWVAFYTISTLGLISFQIHIKSNYLLI